MEATSQPKLLFPQLQAFYRCAEPLSWALIRITAGLMLIPHGWPKLMMGVGATAQMPRFTSAELAVALTPAMSFGQPCGISMRPAVMRISAHESGSTHR